MLSDTRYWSERYGSAGRGSSGCLGIEELVRRWHGQFVFAPILNHGDGDALRI
jgi:hypothetical protein